MNWLTRAIAVVAPGWALQRERSTQALKAFYERLLAAGKPPKVAQTAASRKLLTWVNAMVRDNKEWDDAIIST